MRSGLRFLALLGATALFASTARADVRHTVARGHTIEAIAARYRVTARSIIAANKLKNPDRLKIGAILTIPNVAPPKKGPGDKDDKKGGTGKAPGKGSKPTKPTTYAARPKTPGVVHLRRAGSSEEARVRVKDKRGRLPTTALKSLEKALRSPSGASHPVDPRLVTLLGVVSNHFGSRKIEVVSGFRPYSPTQHTAHSNHNRGKAIDFRVVGVPNEVVRDFCRTLQNVGCGYYPNSTFVHMDVRDASTYWVDYSRPGEPPRYNAARGAAPDEGTSDVEGAEAASANTGPTSASEDDPAPGAAAVEAGQAPDDEGD